jgi:hypothetical protein
MNWMLDKLVPKRKGRRKEPIYSRSTKLEASFCSKGLEPEEAVERN